MAYILTVTCMLFRLRNMYNAFVLSEMKYNFDLWCRNKYHVPHTELNRLKLGHNNNGERRHKPNIIMRCSWRFIDIRKSACFLLIITQAIMVGLDKLWI